DGHATFSAQQASRFVETEDPIEAAAVDQFAAGVETGVTITAAKTVGEQGARRRKFENFPYLVVPCRLMDVLVRALRVTPPGDNSLDGWRSRRLPAQGRGR